MSGTNVATGISSTVSRTEINSTQALLGKHKLVETSEEVSDEVMSRARKIMKILPEKDSFMTETEREFKAEIARLLRT